MSSDQSTSGRGSASSGGRRTFWRALRWIGGIVVAVLFVFLALGVVPRAEPLGDDVAVLEAGATTVMGAELLPYSARYSTWSRVLGVPIKRGSVQMTVDRASTGVAISYDFGGGFSDEMLVDGETLAPIQRGFPGQTFVFDGSHVRAELGVDGEDRDVRSFDFPGRPFEVSILDLVLATGVELPVRMGWDNFSDPSAWLAHARAIKVDTVSITSGETFVTRVVDIGFADGTIRRYWLANRPPYKIRQRTFERGRSIVSAWDVEQFQLR